MSTVFEQDKTIDVNQAIELMREQIQSVLSEETAGSEGNACRFRRLKAQIPTLSPLRWLRKQEFDKKIYWSDRENKTEIAGIGIADYHKNESKDNSQLLERLGSNLKGSDKNIRYFGGFKFDSNQPADQNWQKFGDNYFILPRFEISCFKGLTSFICNLHIEKDKQNHSQILSELKTLSFSQECEYPHVSNIISRADFPNKSQWFKNILAVLKAFDNKQYEKIVLARKTELEFDNKLKSLEILEKLKKKTSNSYHFCFQVEKDLVFIGASPERLYYRQGDNLYSEAVAGTRPRGVSIKADEALGRELLNNEKEIREHRYVIDSIRDACVKLSNDSIDTESLPVNLLKLARIQHLVSLINIKLKKGITDNDLIDALHPTAAVGGYPKDCVMDEISRLEQFDRGWYAAPVGWIGQDSAEFVVAIRSGLVNNNILNLYSGAGIIKGSTAENEWDEIENKIGNFIKVLS